MDTTRKRINLGATTTIATEIIFNRTLSIIGSGECDLHDLFSHELAPIPTSLLLDDSSMRPASPKSKHNNYRTVEIPVLIVLDGCTIYWTINCPISCTILDLVNAVAQKGALVVEEHPLLLTAVIILFCNPRSYHSLCLLLSLTNEWS